MKLKDAFRRAMLSVGCEDCMAMAQAAGVEPGDCGSCDEECRACAERAADALAGRMMPEGTEWPRFADGEPVRIGDEAADDTDGFESVGAVRIDKDGWTLLNEWRTYIDYGGFGATATRYTQPAPEPADAVRCADCKHARVTPRGLSCALHGGAGWFVTDADGYCHRGERRWS